MDKISKVDNKASVVITNSFFLLKRFFKTYGTNNGYYISFASSSSRIMDFLVKHGVQSIDPVILSPNRQEAILNDYIEAVGKLGEWNGHIPHWWITEIASKNAYTNPFLKPIGEFIHCLDAIQKVRTTNNTLFIIGSSWPTVMTLRRIALNNEWNLSVLCWACSRITSKWFGKAKTWIGMFRNALGTLREIIRTNKCFGRKIPLIEKNNPVYLIKSFVYPDSFKDNGSYQDPFFGELADYLTEELSGKAKVMTIALGFANKQDCYKRMRNLRKSKVIPLESMLSCGDVVKDLCHLSWELILKPFKVKGSIEFLGYDIADLMRELLASEGWRIPYFHYLHRAIGERLARNYNIITCALTYEGNPWERAFIVGIKRGSPNTRIIGYQHSVIPQVAVNMFQSYRELKKIPLPDVLLTTGEVPADILQEHGAFPKERVKISCALRYHYLDKIKKQPRHRMSGHGKIRVLVALCGVVKTLPLLRYAIDQACSFQHIDLLIRTHPVLPFDQLQVLIGDVRSIPSNIKISHGSTVMEDVLSCDAVIYWGSSVALEAIRLGKPVIHFNQGDFLSYDPLFDLKDFKWIVNPRDDILNVLEHINNLSDNEFEELRDKAQSYVIAYHNPVSKEALLPFLSF